MFKSIVVSAIIGFVTVTSAVASNYKEVATGMISYQSNKFQFPDESTYINLPEAIPCKVSNLPNTGDRVECSLLMYSRTISVPTSEPGEYAQTSNIIQAVCRGGTCKSRMGEHGWWSKDTNLFVSFWYYVKETNDGRAIAVRRDLDREFSYVEAGTILHRWYYSIGMSDDYSDALLNGMYQTGFEGFINEFYENCDKPEFPYSCGE